MVFSDFRPIRKNFKILLAALLMTIGLSACTLAGGEKGEPLPEMTFAHIQRLELPVDSILVENHYDPVAADSGSAVQLPEPPDMLLRRFFEQRFVAAGGHGSFHIAVEDARILAKKIAAPGALSRLTDLGGSTRFEVLVQLRLYFTSPQGSQSDHSILNFEKAFTIPDYMSLAERETVMFRFLEELVADIDQSVTSVLSENFFSFISNENRRPSVTASSDVLRSDLDVSGADPAALAAPEMR